MALLLDQEATTTLQEARTVPLCCILRLKIVEIQARNQVLGSEELLTEMYPSRLYIWVTSTEDPKYQDVLIQKLQA